MQNNMYADHARTLGGAGSNAALIAALAAYQPQNEQEEMDAAEILRRLNNGEALWTRDNVSAHLTASAWVVSPDRAKVLMCYHKLYRSWSWLGGHADGDTDLLAVALREVREESGLTRLRPVSPDIYSVEILTVDGHEKRGASGCAARHTGRPQPADAAIASASPTHLKECCFFMADSIAHFQEQVLPEDGPG